MNKLHAALAAILFAAAACPAAGAAGARDDAPFALPASFGGTSLCADCSGIRLTLTLEPDGTFRSRRKYIGRPPATTWYDRGTWRYESAGSTLALHSRGNNNEYYRVVDARTLQPLDAYGDPLPARVQRNLTRLPHVERIGGQRR